MEREELVPMAVFLALGIAGEMERTMEREELVPMAEAARELRTTGLRVLMLLREGKLQGKECNGEWYFSRESLAACNGVVSAAVPRHCSAGCGGGGCRHPEG